MNKKLAIINFLRGFSILTIVSYHLSSFYDFPNLMQKAFMFGGAGVHVFILCSGFGLYLSHLKNELSYPSFLKKRFSKIYVPYIIVILATAIWMYFQTGEHDFTTIMSHLFLFKMFIEKYENSFGCQMWFISTILQFYFLWPVIIKLYKKNILYTYIISLIWAIFVITNHLEEFRIFNSACPQYLWEFTTGMFLADMYNKNKKIPMPNNKILLILGITGIILTGITGYLGGVWKSFNDVPSLIGYISIAILIYRLRFTTINKAVSFMNSFSYELYLVHILVYSICRQLITGKICIALEIPICFISACIIAYLFHQFYIRISSVPQHK